MSGDGANVAGSGKSPTLLSAFIGFTVNDEDARLCRDIPDSQCREQPANIVYQTGSQALSKIGDGLADAKVVLPWLLGSLGAPGYLVGLLVPIRESLALLPQVLIGSVIRRYPIRKTFWVASSLVEGLCVLLMGVLALLGMRGALVGWLVIGLLVIFSLARGVASIAAKDVLGKTVSKGRRGRVSGHAAMISGIVASLMGIYFALTPAQGRPDWLLYAMVAAAGVSWLVSAAVYARIEEYPGATEGGVVLSDLLRDQIRLLIADRELQIFLVARTLMISTALVGPLYVSLAQRETGLALNGLGWLVIASGLASTLSASFWGRFADTSSRLTMALAALIAGILGFAVVLALIVLPGLGKSIYFYAVVLFVLGIAHAGVRIGRKTHVVDIAGGDRKAEYVALSNTIIGVLLLLLGLIVSLVLAFGLEWGIGLLALGAMAGALTALRLKDAQADGAS